MKRLFTYSAAFVIACSGLNTVEAQNPPMKEAQSELEKSKSSNKNQKSDQDRSDRTQSERTTGDVISIRQAWVSGGSTVCLVTLKNEEGKSILVDLGPARAARQLGLQLGDEMSAEGEFRNIQKMRVLMASKASSGKTSFTVSRTNIADEEGTASKERVNVDETPQANQEGTSKKTGENGIQLELSPREVTGTVQSTRVISLREGKDKNLLAKLKTKKGRTLMVDLGPVNNLKELSLEPGDEILARGRDAKLPGGKVLIAFYLRADGESISINRRNQIFRQAEDTSSKPGDMSDSLRPEKK